MPLNCPSCSERNPSNAARCIHCGAELQQNAQKRDSEAGTNTKMILVLFTIVVGAGAVLMYISDGNPGELFSNTESYDRICVKRESYKSEARARGYVRCQFKADQRRCTKRKNYSLCLEKKLTDGDERYRPGMF